MSLTVCIPSRGRPVLCREAATTLLQGAVLQSTRLSVALDTDDPELEHYSMPPRCLVSVSDREDSLGAKWNRAQRLCPADLYVIFADDMVMPDKGWDKALSDAAETIPDQCGAVFFGKIEGILQPGIAVTQKFVDAMGFFAQAYTPTWFVDTWLLEEATMSGRGVMADVRVSLLTDVKGTSRGIRDIPFWAGFFDAMRPIRVAVAEKIIKEGPETEERKAALLAALPQWVAHWTHSNSILRDPVQAERLEKFYGFDNEPNERYLRLREQAETILAGLPA